MQLRPILPAVFPCKSRVAQRSVISVCYRNQFSADQANAGRRFLPGHRAKAFCATRQWLNSLDENAVAPDGREAPVRRCFSLFFFFSGNNPIFLLLFARRGLGRSIFSRVLIRALMRERKLPVLRNNPLAFFS